MTPAFLVIETLEKKNICAAREYVSENKNAELTPNARTVTVLYIY